MEDVLVIGLIHQDTQKSPFRAFECVFMADIAPSTAIKL